MTYLTPNRDALCECGCETPLPPGAYNGRQRRYVHGHNAGPGYWAHVRRASDDECWQWTGATRRGYGRHKLDGVSRAAHRTAYEMLVGPIPDGLTIDHLCRNTLCCNPAHMEPVTRAENSRRMRAFLTGDQCIAGHALTGDNLRVDHRGKRVCRACKRRRDADRRARRGAATLTERGQA